MNNKDSIHKELIQFGYVKVILQHEIHVFCNKSNAHLFGNAYKFFKKPTHDHGYMHLKTKNDDIFVLNRKFKFVGFGFIATAIDAIYKLKNQKNYEKIKIAKMKKETIKVKDMNSALDEVLRLEKKAKEIRPEKQTIENCVLKIMEELGELATDILKIKQFKVNDEDPEEIRRNLKEEIVDGLIMYMTMVEETNMTKEELMQIFEKKLTKWNKNHLNPKKQ